MAEPDSKLTIVVTGGGTGGHIEPVLAVIEELQRELPKVHIVWIGQKNGPELDAALQANVVAIPIYAGKLRRYFSISNAIDFFKVGVGYFQALRVLMRLKPRVVFSKAGYVSVPTILAAATLGIPIVAHESDTVIGLSNAIATRFADRFCSGFPFSFYAPSIAKKTVFTGNPVTKKVSYCDKKDGFALFSFLDQDPVIVILGGSQGAAKINEVVWESLPHLLERVQVVHHVGPHYTALAQNVKAKLTSARAKRYQFSGYFNRHELSCALTIATCAVVRAGANTIADLSTFAVPAILVPLPHAASNHQMVNAQFVVERGGGILLPQGDFNARTLDETIQTVVGDSKKRDNMSRAIRTINPPDAGKRIADEIISVIRNTTV